MPTWGQFVVRPTRHNNWRRFYLQPFQKNVTGCKIVKWITWRGPRPFQGWSVIRRLTLHRESRQNFRNKIFLELFQGCEIIECITWPWQRQLRGQLVIWRSVLLVTKPQAKFEVCSFSRSEDISWGVKLSNWSRDPCHAYFGTVSCPKANTWYSLQLHEIWRL